MDDEAPDTSGARVTVQVNGKSRDVPPHLTVRALLERLDLVPETIVVERNGEILDRGEYADTVLADGDRLELVHFVGGG